MGDWRLEIFDNTNTTRQAVIPRSDVKDGRRVEELNGEDTLIFTMNRGSEHFDTIDLRDIIRFVDLSNNTSRSFRVRKISDNRKGEVISGEVFCEHIKYDMRGDIYTQWKPYVQADPSSIIDDILGFSSFSSSTISPATLMDIVLNFGTVLESLDRVRKILNTDMFVNEDSTVTFGAHGNNNNVKIKYAKNMRGIQRLQDVHTFFNKFYPFGSGEPPISIGGINAANIEGAEHIVETINGATIGFHDRMVVSNDSLNNLWIEATRPDDLTNLGARRRILDSIANNTIVLATNFSSTILFGDYLKVISNATGDEIQFVKDQVSIDSFGTIAKSLSLNDIAAMHNLVKEAALDGVYNSTPDGFICDEWASNTSTATFFENTDTDFIRFGDRSQKVDDSGASGDGISQPIVTVVDDFYSVGVWVFIETGSVRIEFFDGVTTQPSSGTAGSNVTGVWIQILIEGVKAQDTDGAVRILADSFPTVFYVDGVVVERKSRLTNTNQFNKIGGARQLWDNGVDILRAQNAPRKQYIVGVADLFEGDRKLFQFDQFEIGDTVVVEDTELGIDVSARVRRKEWDIFKPWDAKVQLDNFADNLGKSLRDQQELFASQQKLTGLTSGRTSTDRIISGDDVQRITSKIFQSALPPLS